MNDSKNPAESYHELRLNDPDLDSPPGEPERLLSQREMIAKRLDEYRYDAINTFDSVESNMMLVHADLIQAFQHACEFIDTNAEQWKASPGGFKAVQPAFCEAAKLAREAASLPRFVKREKKNSGI